MRTRLTQDVYEQKVDTVAKTYDMTPDERDRMINNTTGKIIADMPYVVGCKNPDKACLAGLGLLWTAHKDKVFDHKPNDTILGRLQDLQDLMVSGNEHLLRIEMARLGLLSLEDHHTDGDSDTREGKYNPINAGDINYEMERRSLCIEAAIESPDDILDYPGRGLWF